MHMKRIEDIRTIYADHDGVSDSGLGFWLDWILREVKPRTVIIERDIQEVEESLMAMGLGLPATNFCDLLKRKLDEIQDHPLVMRVPFNALGNVRVMQRVWWHLLGPNVAFDEERFEKMNAQRIEVNAEHIAQAFAAEHTIVDQIMPFIRPKETSCLHHGYKQE